MQEATERNIAKRLSVWAILIAAVLMIPLVTSAPWTGSDYVFGAVVLFGFATMYESITRHMSNPKHRTIAGFVVAGVLCVVWVGAATGFEGIIDRLG